MDYFCLPMPRFWKTPVTCSPRYGGPLPRARRPACFLGWIFCCGPNDQRIASLAQQLNRYPTMIDLTSKQLRRAANIKDKIETLQRDLQRLLGGTNSAGGTETKATRKRRKMSAAARAKISAA